MKKLNEYEEMLVIVDMVNGFVNAGALHDERIKRIVPRIIELVERTLKRDGLLVWMKDTHTKESREHGRFKGAHHCLKGSGEELIIPELISYEEKGIAIEKNSTSFMEAPKFRELMLKLENLRRINVVGCCTDICVFNGSMGLANYLDEHNKNIELFVHEDAIATFGEDVRTNYVDAARLLMEQQGIKLVRKKED